MLNAFETKKFSDIHSFIFIFLFTKLCRWEQGILPILMTIFCITVSLLDKPMQTEVEVIFAHTV